VDGWAFSFLDLECEIAEEESLDDQDNDCQQKDEGEDEAEDSKCKCTDFN
jgi:hypothetical protein